MTERSQHVDLHVIRQDMFVKAKFFHRTLKIHEALLLASSLPNEVFLQICFVGATFIIAVRASCHMELQHS